MPQQRISQYLRDYKVRLIDDLDAPVLTATALPVTGSTTIEYKATFKTIVGETLPSETATVTNAGNLVSLVVSNIPSIVTHVRFWKNFSGTWKLLSEEAVGTGQYLDTMTNTGTTATIPVENTSGRPGVMAIMPKPATFHQRQSWSDLMSLMSDMVQDLGNTLHRDGDVREGCIEYPIAESLREPSTAYDVGDFMVISALSSFRYECTTAGTTASTIGSGWPTTVGATFVDGTATWTCRPRLWGFGSGKIYFLGRFVSVPECPSIAITGVGAEKVGISVTPVYSTPDDDLVQRCADDEGCLPIYANTGPDWLYFQLDWVKDTDNQVDIKEFDNGVPKMATIAIERSELDKTWARRQNAVSGSFVVENFPLRVVDHPTDESKLQLKIDAGYAFPNGYEVRTTGTRSVNFDRARTTKKVNGAGIETFNHRGAVNEWNYWEADAEVALGTIRVPNLLNGWRYMVTSVAGDSETGSTEPTWTETPGSVISDNDVQWTCLDNLYHMKWSEWAATTAYALGMIKVPTTPNTFKYMVIAVTGDAETGETEPEWPLTAGLTVVDNEVTWLCVAGNANPSVTVQAGSGNTHTVTFLPESSSDSMTGAQVLAAITAYVNAVPVGENNTDIIDGSASEGIFQLQAASGKSLTLGGTAIDFFGWDAGTTEAEGTRVYQVNDPYVWSVEDMVYAVTDVVQVTYNATTQNVAVGSGVTKIHGASDTAANAHDMIFEGAGNYEEGVDFVRGGFDSSGNQVSGNNINFYGMSGKEPGAGATFYVKYTRNYNATKGSRQLIKVENAKVVRGAGSLIDNLTYTDATAIYRLSNNSAVTPSGTPIEVVEITAVKDNPAVSAYYVSQELLTNSGALEHETSQIDWSSSTEPGTGTGGRPDNTHTYYVDFICWYHNVEGDFITADSYDTYEEVPLAPNGVWKLRDCVDFRTSGGTWPDHGISPSFDYYYCLGRIDKLVLDDLGNFQLISGAPAQTPPTPPDQAGNLTLAVLRILPYTYTKSDVSVVSVEPIRITQKGIQRLQERIERLEYWQTLNSLESEVEGNIPDGADAQGIFTDSLTGWGRMDLSFDRDGVSHTAALDRFERAIRLPATETLKYLTVDLDDPANTHVRRAGNSIMLDYLPEVIIDQPKASIWVNGAHDNVVTNYYGHMQISPETDAFIDEQQLPQVNVDFDDQFTQLIDAMNPVLANNINWGDWNTKTNKTGGAMLWSGNFQSGGIAEPYSFTWIGSENVTSVSTRSGIETQLMPGALTKETIDGIVDMSLQGYMRTKNPDGTDFTIQLEINGLLPNQDHVCTINGIYVDLVYDDDPINGNATGSQSVERLGVLSVKTSNTGTMSAKIVMPEGVLVGSATIKVFYYADPDVSVCSCSFYSAGFRMQSQDTVIGLPTVETTATALTETVSSYTENTWFYDEAAQKANQYGSFCIIDPLAQTFTTPNSQTYISAVELFFKSVDADYGYTVEIRDVVNGYPGTKIYASTHKNSSEITASDNGATGTVFTFENVLLYAPNTDFCFVGRPDAGNTGYNLWCSELSTVDFITGERIEAHPHDGTLFHSPNNKTWSSDEPWSRRDLKFKIYRSNFENDARIVFDNLSGVEASALITRFDETVFPGTNVKWFYTTSDAAVDDDDWVAYNPYINTDLGDVISQIKLRIDITAMGGSYEIIEKHVGIKLLYHDASANYIGRNEYFTDALNYPNKISMTADIDADSINSGSGTLTQFMATIDDGVRWFIVPLKEGYSAVAAGDPYYRYQAETPDEATITEVTGNGVSPIVVTSANHGYTENMAVLIAGVGGNTAANGTYIATNVTSDTFELYTTDGTATTGDGAYTTGGTINLAEFSQIRPRIRLATDSRARTPRVRNIGCIASAI